MTQNDGPGALGINGLRIGMTTDAHHHTGCTVLLPPEGSIGAIAIRGGAPGTREAGVLSPGSANTAIHAVTLCGSSLFGLRAAGGVADWCAENDIGLELPGGRFPIVGAAVVMDIHSPEERRIGHADGVAACEAATFDDPEQGSVGVGTGCSLGKEAGRAWGSKGGQGWATATSGDVIVSAIMAVNAFGSVYAEGEILAGSRAPADYPRYPASPPDQLLGLDGEPIGGTGWGASDGDDGPTANTVIGAVITNAVLTKSTAHRVADLAHTGIARTVRPAHTNFDGDAMFAIGTGEVEAGTDLVNELAAEAVSAAILNGVRHARGTERFPADPRAAG